MKLRDYIWAAMIGLFVCLTIVLCYKLEERRYDQLETPCEKHPIYKLGHERGYESGFNDGYKRGYITGDEHGFEDGLHAKWSPEEDDPFSNPFE